jgi:hypothetical protein
MKKNLVLDTKPNDSMWCKQCLHSILLSDGYAHCISDNQCFSDDACPLEIEFSNFSSQMARQSCVNPVKKT